MTLARPLAMLLLLIGFANPVVAQNPAVRMAQGHQKQCVNVTVKNLIAAPLTVTLVELSIFEQNTCVRRCVLKKSVHWTIHSCASINQSICCQHPLPAVPGGYIYWLRLHGSSGVLTEDWLFAP
jgi:hypothetical protein